jgi:tubulin beta
MGTEFWELVCNEHGIGGSGEYCGDNDAHLGRINVLFTRPVAASTYPARCSSTSSPA